MTFKTQSVLLAASLTLILSACTEPSQNTSAEPEMCSPEEGIISLSNVQWIGTHNSYHIAPDRPLLDYMVETKFNEGDYWDGERLSTALDYTHPSLTDQLVMGLRHFELDVYDDPEGGKYANPGFFSVLPTETAEQLEPVDPAGDLNDPGFKVFHAPDSDVRSRCLKLSNCLAEINAWRADNPEHLPIVLNIEVKNIGGDPLGPQYEPVSPVEIGPALWERLHAELNASFIQSELVLPSDVRGDYQTIKEAIAARGWPSVESGRGKVLIFLLDSRTDNQSYFDFASELDEERLLHVALGADHAATSWLNGTIEEDTVGNMEGYMIYSRADISGDEARTNDTSRRDAVFDSGAQIISTDFPMARTEYSPYYVKFDGGYVRYKGGECSKTLDE